MAAGRVTCIWARRAGGALSAVNITSAGMGRVLHRGSGHRGVQMYA
jgi:hypothetical protein